MKKIVFPLVFIFIFTSLISLAFAADSIPIGNIVIDQENVMVFVGKAVNVKATIEPKNATNKKLEWTSSDETIATVNNGQIKGIACGEVIITIKATDESKINTNIKVVVIQPIKRITIPDKKLTLAPGTTHQLSWVIEPENASITTLSWTSSDEKVAVVDDSGLITAIGTGSTNIVATATDGSKVKASASVKVQEYDLVFTSTRPQKFKYAWSSGTGNFKLRGTVKNGNVSIPNIDTDGWRSGGASTDSIEITPLRAGTDVVTIRLNNSKVDCTVFVADSFEEYIIQYVEVPDTSPDPSNGSFRDIIYGTPYSEIKEQLVKQYGDDYSTNEYTTGMDITFNQPKVNVAGHDVVSLTFTFCYDQDENGYINKDETVSSFYKAEYLFKIKEYDPFEIASDDRYDIVAEDLYYKLKELYGETYCSYGETYSYDWYNNGIYITLYDSYDNVSVIYTWGSGRTKALTLLETDEYLKSYSQNEKRDAEKDNYGESTDGL